MEMSSGEEAAVIHARVKALVGVWKTGVTADVQVEAADSAGVAFETVGLAAV